LQRCPTMSVLTSSALTLSMVSGLAPRSTDFLSQDLRRTMHSPSSAPPRPQAASLGCSHTSVSLCPSSFYARAHTHHQIHQAHYENFYNLRGRFALWTSKDNSTAGRIFTPGDYGAVPPNTTHSFQILDPFTEMVGVVQPGGFEDLFYFLASANYTSSTYAPFPQGNFTTPGGDADTISKLQDFDVWAELQFSPPMDFNAAGTSGNDKAAVWRNGVNQLGKDSATPFFVAKSYGPMRLSSSSSNDSYYVVEPFITSTQSDGNFTEGTITLSQLSSDAQADEWSLPGHTALEVVDGLVGVKVQGYDEMSILSVGDVVFVPANTTWSFWGEAAYSKVLYVCQGRDTLDARLRAAGISWESVVWPA
jgi:quercetin dioxygenase-like cupin family protein